MILAPRAGCQLAASGFCYRSFMPRRPPTIQTNTIF